VKSLFPSAFATLDFIGDAVMLGVAAEARVVDAAALMLMPGIPMFVIVGALYLC
jgi:hypothetical protein